MKDPQKIRDERQKQTRAISMGIMIPAMMTACVLVGVIGGYYLDKWLDLGGLGILGGLVCGMAAAGREVYKLIKKMNSEV